VNIVPQSATLKFITPNAVELIAECARLCYKSEKKGNEAAFLQMLLRKQHLTPFEMADAIFHVVCDRGVSHEAVRHRIASYLQESTRFCNYSSEKFGSSVTFIEPPGMNGVQGLRWVEAVSAAEGGYLDLTGDGVQAQIARSVLPNALKTEFAWKMNFHGWLHMLELRYFGLTGPPHPQMLEVATFIHDTLVAEVPEVFGPAAFAAKWNGAISAYRKALEKLDG
jgi:thymidylate synthase (FAD)